MRIGLYFGTFNPIHIGHLIIANHMAENTDLDQIWMVVTPHNPQKKKNVFKNTDFLQKKDNSVTLKKPFPNAALIYGS